MEWVLLWQRSTIGSTEKWKVLLMHASTEGNGKCAKAGKEIGLLKDGMKDIKSGRIMKFSVEWACAVCSGKDGVLEEKEEEEEKEGGGGEKEGEEKDEEEEGEEERKFHRKEREAHRAELKAHKRQKKKMELMMDSDLTLTKEAQMIAMAESPLLARILMQLVNQYEKI
ncbi:uncharacterized protein MONOS_4935 [Monocercomonoides exilis]|uniref:uncharacterized protein n=1 Tax=Monocercomonoides exilis TaxID=2049356 RepID=UPI0035593725|nr:hypothetical protein MONOS_4935 [Monocercomonoides exilis]|eukprot:MONOS_4935.1-p1 / transcript=MONOS_4935.1 / gene=MONOS_4935 / organism=Monocercomonoides_exilis_PA203 / gene_product=unspecified product / transcript_product=unspecified product / location=Mono_scaffold00138:63081-64029(+) / protein_length=169 / sequence_SO=supercontig / SO=protein_coding / is_pseudo=false